MTRLEIREKFTANGMHSMLSTVYPGRLYVVLGEGDVAVMGIPATEEELDHIIVLLKMGVVPGRRESVRGVKTSP